MPWFPELFSASVLDRMRREAADTRAAEPVPYFAGLRSGETEALVGSSDAEAAVATFEPNAYVREPSGSAYVHRGQDELRALYERFFSNGGGIELEHCSVTDDGRACALEYNVVRWGRTELSRLETGLAVYVRGGTGKLASARMYDDADPPVPLEG